MSIMYQGSTSTGTGATFMVEPPGTSFAVQIKPSAAATVALHGSLDGQTFYQIASSTFASSTGGTHVKAYASTVGPVAHVRAVVAAWGSTVEATVLGAASAARLRKAR